MYSFLFFLLFLNYCECLEIFSRPQGWLFGYSQQQICRVRLENQHVKVNLTQIYDLKSEQMLEIPSLPHYCAPQACISLNKTFAFICLNYTDYKFRLFNNQNEKVEILKLEGRMVRYDSMRQMLALWNGRTVRLFQLERNGSVGAPVARIRPELSPLTSPTDMHIFNTKVYFLINGSVYELSSKEGRLQQKIFTGLYTFPFQYFSLNDEDAQTTRTPRSTGHSNMNQIFANLAFPLLSLLEFGLLIAIAYFFKWKVYKGRDGRLGIRPQNSDSNSEEEGTNPQTPIYIPLENRENVSKA